MISSQPAEQIRGAKDAVLALWLLGWALFIAPACAPPPIQYVYDANGRLVAVIDTSQAQPNGRVYQYNAAGNLTSIATQDSSQVSVLGFTPPCGNAGTTVTIYGTAFTTSSTVTFNGTPAGTVTFINANQLTATVASGTTSGGIAVSGVSNASLPAFRVDGCGAPTITDVTTNIGGSCATKPIGAPGSPGTQVTLLGANFDSNVANDRLGFNDVGAIVPDTAAATSLTTTVPTRATSGTLAVTTAYGRATSPCDFFIPPSGYTVGQVDLTHSGRMGNPTSAGTPYTLTLPPNPSVALTLFDGVQGRRACLMVTDTSSLAGAIKFFGYDVAGAQLWNIYPPGDRFVDAFTFTQTGTYTILADPSGATGMLTFNLYDVAFDLLQSVAVATPVPVQITSACQNAYLRFPVTATHRASGLGSLPPPGSGCWSLAIRDLDGQTSLGGVNSCVSGTFVETDPTKSLAGGTYTLVFDPQGLLTGTFTLTVYDVADVTGSITPGTPKRVTTDTPGQNVILSFNNITINQRVSLKVSTWSGSFFDQARIYRPDGTRVVGDIWSFGDGYGDDWVEGTLDATGQHTLRFDPDGPHTGSPTFSLYDVPADATGSTTVGAPGTTITTTTPGQNAKVTFSSGTGQQVTVTVTNHIGPSSGGTGSGSDNCVDVSLVPPGGGSAVASASSCTYNQMFTLSPAPTSVTTQSTYTIVIDPRLDNTGSVDVRVS